jgi:hypothetical protein
MLGDAAVAHAEDHHVAGRHVLDGYGHEVAAAERQQALGAGRLAPVARIGRHRLRLKPDRRPPDAAHQADAVAPDAFHRCLVVIGRADPRSRLGDDPGGQALS